jgi:hypothetical protein
LSSSNNRTTVAENSKSSFFIKQNNIKLNQKDSHKNIKLLTTSEKIEKNKPALVAEDTNRKLTAAEKMKLKLSK